MANWTLKSLSRGIRTTRWPRRPETAPGITSADQPLDATWMPAGSRGPLPRRFRHSVHVRFVDAGASGAVLGEIRLIDAPPYNMHRFGIFITASPREADVLLVAGPVTEAMRGPLRKAYNAMPEPRRVVAVGDDAMDGGVYGQSFASAGGVGAVLAVDFVVPGDPPAPLAIIHGLLAVSGQIKVGGDV
jgi:Ni,Fe-hydrogenase III small subunit